METDVTQLLVAYTDGNREALDRLLPFGGLTNEEAAEALEVSLRTVERDLSFARAWLSKAWSGALNL